jgi:hypothetical protein
MTQHSDRPQAYWDDAKQKWLIDDYGRPREATPEEIEQSQRERR